MRHLKYILSFVVVISLSAFVQKSEGYYNAEGEYVELEWRNWNEGYEEMMETGKIGLIDIYTDWCGWCKRMDKDTYAKPDVINRINKYCVPIKFNPEENMTYRLGEYKLTGPELKSWLLERGGGYPTTVFMIPQSRTKYTESGYMAQHTFLSKLDEIIGHYRNAKRK